MCVLSIKVPIRKSLEIYLMILIYIKVKDLVWFYAISTIVGYLMPNPVFTYILNTWFVNVIRLGGMPPQQQKEKSLVTKYVESISP